MAWRHLGIGLRRQRSRRAKGGALALDQVLSPRTRGPSKPYTFCESDLCSIQATTIQIALHPSFGRIFSATPVKLGILCFIGLLLFDLRTAPMLALAATLKGWLKGLHCTLGGCLRLHWTSCNCRPLSDGSIKVAALLNPFPNLHALQSGLLKTH